MEESQKGGEDEEGGATLEDVVLQMDRLFCISGLVFCFGLEPSEAIYEERGEGLDVYTNSEQTGRL